MEIVRVVTGSLDENCYVLKKNGTALVVDPGDDYHKIKEVIGEDKVIGVLITHSHFDHVGALRHFLNNRRIKMFKRSIVQEREYVVGDFTFDVIYTPGHAKDEVTFYFKEDNVMFVGDFIFKDSIGRCDLPGGDSKEMERSLEKIKEYPKDITLYPGHGEDTTLERELEENPYLK